jgi:hypothetical protein
VLLLLLDPVLEIWKALFDPVLEIWKALFFGVSIVGFVNLKDEPLNIDRTLLAFVSNDFFDCNSGVCGVCGVPQAASKASVVCRRLWCAGLASKVSVVCRRLWRAGVWGAFDARPGSQNTNLGHCQRIVFGSSSASLAKFSTIRAQVFLPKRCPYADFSEILPEECQQL